jgi:hypothetical protein
VRAGTVFNQLQQQQQPPLQQQQPPPQQQQQRSPGVSSAGSRSQGLSKQIGRRQSELCPQLVQQLQAGGGQHSVRLIEATQKVGSVMYMAPEVLTGEPEADIGCVEGVSVCARQGGCLMWRAWARTGLATHMTVHCSPHGSTNNTWNSSYGNTHGKTHNSAHRTVANDARLAHIPHGCEKVSLVGVPGWTLHTSFCTRQVAWLPSIHCGKHQCPGPRPCSLHMPCAARRCCLLKCHW